MAGSDLIVTSRNSSAASLLITFCVLASGCNKIPSFEWTNPFDGPPPAYKTQYGLTPPQKVDRLRAIAQSASGMDVTQQEKLTQELAATLSNENDPILRREIVRTLGSFSTMGASDALLLAVDDPHEQVRVAACEAWGRRGDPQAGDVLASILAEDDEVDVRLAASKALARRSGQGSLAHLAATLEDRDPAVQLATMESLRQATGLNIGNDINGWLAYLNTQQGTIIDSPPTVPPNRLRDPVSATAQLVSGENASTIASPPVYEDDSSIFR